MFKYNVINCKIHLEKFNKQKFMKFEKLSFFVGHENNFDKFGDCRTFFLFMLIKPKYYLSARVA